MARPRSIVTYFQNWTPLGTEARESCFFFFFGGGKLIPGFQKKTFCSRVMFYVGMINIDPMRWGEKLLAVRTILV